MTFFSIIFSFCAFAYYSEHPSFLSLLELHLCKWRFIFKWIWNTRENNRSERREVELETVKFAVFEHFGSVLPRRITIDLYWKEKKRKKWTTLYLFAYVWRYIVWMRQMPPEDNSHSKCASLYLSSLGVWIWLIGFAFQAKKTVRMNNVPSSF